MVSSLCNQLLVQFSLNVSQTSQIYCAHIENVFVGFDGARIYSTELQPFRHSHLGSVFALYGLINNSYNFFEGFFSYFVNMLRA